MTGASWVIVALLTIPLGLDLYLPAPEDNPLTRSTIELGLQLFNDRRLSRDYSVSCASCHEPELAFADSRAVSVGAFGRRGRRNAPSLVNRAYGRTFFWDGRVTTLEAQVLRPIEDPDEMDLPLDQARRRLGLPPTEISRALASYVRSILAGDAPYDRYVNGDDEALSTEQRTGLEIFRGKARCALCHAGPTLTDERFHNTGVAWAGGRYRDEGRFALTSNTAERGAFKTPSLREVARTAPYMHDGSLATLEMVVDFYDEGGRANPALDPELRPLRLEYGEKRSLIAFLSALSGRVRHGP